MSKVNKLNTSKKWSTDEIKKFLEVYEEYPCLWNYKIPSYKDRNQRDTALRKIVEVMSDIVGDFDVNAAKAKIRSIRNAYTLEYHKVLASYKSGTSTDAIYKPTVGWYNVADRFLKGIVETRKTKNTLEQEEEQNSEEDHSHSQEDLGAEENTVDSPFAKPHSPLTENAPTINSEKRSAKKRTIIKKDKSSLIRKPVSDVENVTAAVSALQDIVQKVDNCQETTDEFEVFGRPVAAHLKQLPLNDALESQSEILTYLVQRRLGHKKALSSATIPQQHSSFISSPYLSPSASTSSYGAEQAYIMDNENRSSVEEQHYTENENAELLQALRSIT